MKKSGLSPKFAIGATSLLAVFVILSLLAFAMLTYTTAQNDERLALKTAAATTAYYQLRSAAEATLAQALTCLAAEDWPGLNQLGVTHTPQAEGTELVWEQQGDNGKVLSYRVVVRDSGELLRNTYIVTE